jgi:hypothetical protein
MIRVPVDHVISSVTINGKPPIFGRAKEIIRRTHYICKAPVGDA